ncbi:Coiled-coil domain-containing protein 147, partial [Gryllus bimaculatus]
RRSWRSAHGDGDGADTQRSATLLGSQLVAAQRTSCPLLYREDAALLEAALQKGETQYTQRLEDIRLLKIEVRRLRNEKVLLQRSLDNMAKLRKEVFHLERDLTRERQKTRALEEELQNPLNVHRWRKLQGTDPCTFDLIEKVQLLQKRLLAQAAVAIEREVQLRDAQRLYAGLRQLLERQPGPEVAVTLHRTQQALRERGRKM